MAILRAEPAGCGRIRNANAVDDSVSDTPKGSFPKSAHLLKHSDFQRVYQQGRRHFSGNMTVFYLRTPAETAPESNLAGTASARTAGGVRIGFTVSKALGGSVERNRMRRRTREAVRHHLLLLQGISGTVHVVINPKKSLLAAEFPQISQEVERAFGVIRQNCGRSSEVGGTKTARRETRRR
jgi:ribonuclease P protein component